MTMRWIITDKCLVQLRTYILSNIHSVLYHSPHYSDFVISLGFPPPFFRPSVCKSLQSPPNYSQLLFFSRFQLQAEKEGRQKSYVFNLDIINGKALQIQPWTERE